MSYWYNPFSFQLGLSQSQAIKNYIKITTIWELETGCDKALVGM